jgi:hypothetical protein
VKEHSAKSTGAHKRHKRLDEPGVSPRRALPVFTELSCKLGSVLGENANMQNIFFNSVQRAETNV